MKAQADVLVIGAGPGGLAAALRLREAGADVILVDARDRIGHPARCAEMVVEEVFAQWGLEPRPGWIRNRAWLRDRGDDRRPLLILDRARAEHGISLVAAERGVEVAPGTAAVALAEFDGECRQVTLRSRAGTRQVAARCVVAADGVSSSVARMAGIDASLHPDEVASGLACRVEGATLADPESIHMAPLPPELAPPPCYYWVAPHGPRSANVGLALPGRDGNRARRLLARMMESDQACRGGRVVETLAGLLPGRRPLERPFRNGLLVVGGAARMVHPVSGAGIIHAARSGRAAAEQLVALGGRPATEENLAGYRGRIAEVYRKLEEGWQRLEELRRQAAGAGGA